MAKRVNTPFVAVVASVIFMAGGIVAFGPIVKNRLTRRPTAEVVKENRLAAEKLVKERRFLEAKDAITAAWSADRSNKEVAVERGDIFVMLTEEEGPAIMDAARACWEDALVIDPGYKPALHRLVDSYVDQMEIAPSGRVCESLRQAAERLLRVEPADQKTRSYLYISAVQEWVLGGKGEQVKGALNSLEALQKKDPTAGDVLFYLVRGKAYQAVDDYRKSQNDLANELLSECRAAVDTSMAADARSASLNFRGFQSYVIIADTGHDPAQSVKDRDAANAALARARELVDPKDPRYADFQYVAADWARRNGRTDEAEKILRAFYESHGSDQRARLALARQIGYSGDPAKRDEAIKILNMPILLSGERGVRALPARELEAHTLLDLTALRVAQYATLEPSKRPALMQEIEATYKKIVAMSNVPDAIPVLRLRGLIHQLKGEEVEAVEALSRAMTLLEHSDPNNSIKYDLMYQLATADRIAGQNRAAEKLLSQLVEKFAGYIPARIQLAELYLQENNLAEATQQVSALAARKPGSADVIRLEMALMQRSARPEDARKFYAQLPERTFEEQASKAQAAANLKDHADAIRLLRIMQQEKPTDNGIVVALHQEYLRSDDRAKARAVLTDALARSPKEPQFLIPLHQMDGASAADTDQYVETLLARDPFSKEIQDGRRANAQDDFAQALDHARIASQLRPNDPATWDLYFQIYRKQRNWEMAAKAVENLQRLDADHANGRMYRWTLAMARGEYLDAAKVARELTVVRDSFGQSWMLLAQAYQANGQYQEALKHYEAALERQTTNIDTYKGIAECYYALSQPERAREQIEAGRRMFPDSITLREMALAYDTNVNPQAVVPIRRKLLEQNPEEPENYLALSSTCAHAAQRIFPSDPNLARSFIEQARDVLTKGVGKFPDHIRLNSALAEALQNAGQPDEGVRILRDLALHPTWKDRPDPLLVLADYYARARKMDDAEHALRDAWAISKNRNVDVELQLSQHLIQRQKFDEATAVLKTNATDPRVVRQALQAHIAAGHTDIATHGLQDELSRNPNNTDLLNLLTVVYIDGYRFPEARKTAAQVLEIDHGHNDIALYYQALTELRDPVFGDMEVAIKDLRTVVARNPRNIRYKLDYAEALSRVRDYERSTLELEEAVRIDAYNRDVRLRLLNAYSTLKKWTQFEEKARDAELNPAISEGIWFREHAYALAAQSRFPEALAKIHEAIAMDSHNQTFARDYLIILLQSKDYDTVFHETDRLVEAGHREWWVYHLRGLARIASGKKAEALEQFDKAMAVADETKDVNAYQQVLDSMTEISPTDALQRIAGRINVSPHWRLQSVSLHMRKQEWSAAVADVAPLLASPVRESLQRSDRLSALRFAAESYQSMGQAEKSKTYYDQWLAEAPNDPAALNNLAFLLAEDLKRPAEAVEYSRKAYDYWRKFNIVDPMIQDTHGWVLTLCGGDKATEGITLLNSLIDSHPEFLEARYHLAEAYQRKNRPSDALSQITIAMDQVKSMEEKKEVVRPQLKANIQNAFARMSKSARASG